MPGFDKEVADFHRELRKSVEGKEVNTSETDAPNGMDKSVKEQVISDLDGLIEKREKPKPSMGILP